MTIAVLLALALAQSAAAARALRQQPASILPLLPGAPQPQHKTPVFKQQLGTNSGRNNGGDSSGASSEALFNLNQAQTQQGRTGSAVTVALQTAKAGRQNPLTRSVIGQNQAQAIVGNAASGGGALNAAKEQYGNLQYQTLGQGLTTGSDTRTALANIQAQSDIQASLDSGNAFRATQGNADSALATTFNGAQTHEFTTNNN
ncbi:hypothetical protein MNEG_6856 [Monoraphidium neglectum]|uniref:Uncharacterized protein n=1 Tax=Monoraphidium neglectum TaxID=145388 RepID=A0A0D2MD40_9CHLO|nr:hypothetical protein MNEG_6856 [Monoraphidium neglectum]KIZ01105.1 hypothetical protein MNEG_6856 [Monoraphidium neglectum]|eukprot:XP_013900124.1 hypothetical protein MNEG_6856 [Monoraphidium neglectum]